VTLSQPTASVPAWRVAVIGLVGILAVGIGIAVGSFLLSARTAALGGGASYVPASAPFYFEVRLEPSASQDAALRELLGRFPPIDGVDLARPLYEQLTEKLDQAIATEGQDLSWSEDVATWFDGRIGVALLDLPAESLTPPADPLATPVAPPMVLLLGVTDQSEASAAIDRLLATAPEAPTFTDRVHAGTTIRVADGDMGAYALTADQLLIAPAAADIESALDARASGSTTLAEAAEITQLTDALPADWLAFGVYDMTDLMAAAFDQAAEASPGMEAFRELIEHQSLRGAIAITASGDRLAVETVTDPPTGPLAVTNADRGLANEVPDDSLFYADGGNIGAGFAASIGPMKESLAMLPGATDQIDTIEAALSTDLEQMVAWMGDGAMAVGWDGEMPYGGLVIIPTDADDARRRLDQLATFAGLAALDPSTGISVTERDVESVSVTSIRWADPSAGTEPMPPMGPIMPVEITVEWAVTDDRVYLGVGDVFVPQVITLDEADSLASVARYSQAIDDLGGSSNAGVAWADLRGVREAIEAAVGPDMLGSYETDVLPWLAPLDRLVSVSRLEGGILVGSFALLAD
jgi:hypothetical protein